MNLVCVWENIDNWLRNYDQTLNPFSDFFFVSFPISSQSPLNFRQNQPAFPTRRSFPSTCFRATLYSMARVVGKSRGGTGWLTARAWRRVAKSTCCEYQVSLIQGVPTKYLWHTAPLSRILPFSLMFLMGSCFWSSYTLDRRNRNINYTRRITRVQYWRNIQLNIKFIEKIHPKI